MTAAQALHSDPSTLRNADSPQTRLATRLAFLVAGFGVACWAPLVPFAKQRLQVDDGVLGLLMLCLGIGSLLAMLWTALLSGRYGSRPIIIAGGFGVAIFLPVLAVVSSPAPMGFALFAFGASLGSLDVAMNIHAVEVERAAPKPLMSGFHALFSVGGFIGATLIALLFSLGVGPFGSTLLASVAMIFAMAAATPRLLRQVGPGEGPLLVAPRGVVLLFAALAAVMFLVEGAILDWSALLVTGRGLLDQAQAGLAYSIFAVAMTAGRLCGDYITARIGDRATLFWGGLATIAGFVLLLSAPSVLALSGLLLIGLGAANIVPVLFRGAGVQQDMPARLAVAAISTAGYAGVLVGPAGMGLVARTAGLPAAFWMLAALVSAVVFFARAATPQRR